MHRPPGGGLSFDGKPLLSAGAIAAVAAIKAAIPSPATATTPAASAGGLSSSIPSSQQPHPGLISPMGQAPHQSPATNASSSMSGATSSLSHPPPSSYPSQDEPATKRPRLWHPAGGAADMGSMRPGLIPTPGLTPASVAASSPLPGAIPAGAGMPAQSGYNPSPLIPAGAPGSNAAIVPEMDDADLPSKEELLIKIEVIDNDISKLTRELQDAKTLRDRKEAKANGAEEAGSPLDKDGAEEPSKALTGEALVARILKENLEKVTFARHEFRSWFPSTHYRGEKPEPAPAPVKEEEPVVRHTVANGKTIVIRDTNAAGDDANGVKKEENESVEEDEPDSADEDDVKPLYMSPDQVPGYQEFLERHVAQRSRVAAHIKTRVGASTARMLSLVDEYRARNKAWKASISETVAERRPTRSSSNPDMVPESAGIPLTSAGRSTRANGTAPAPGGGIAALGAIRSEAEFDEVMASIDQKEKADPNTRYLRTMCVIPPMELGIDAQYAGFRYINSNGVIEDLVAEEREQKYANPWSAEEKEVFMQKFLLHPKNFHKIATYLPDKETKDVVQYYYNNKKALDLKAVLQKGLSRKRSVTAGRRTAALRMPQRAEGWD